MSGGSKQSFKATDFLVGIMVFMLAVRSPPSIHISNLLLEIGHFTGGGDPGGDFFVSPGEPVFWLHHTQVDRVYTIWQQQDLANRQFAFEGTITFNNDPPSRNGTLDDWLDIGILGEQVKTRDIMNTVGNGLCYIYV
jgi:tyrosinase